MHVYESGFCFRAEVEAYKALDPGVRVLILKAICDIRVEVPFFSIILSCISCNPAFEVQSMNKYLFLFQYNTLKNVTQRFSS